MVNLDFQCRTVSPLFLYGAVPTSSYGVVPSSLELRPPSFKGMLRFWWRAAQAANDVQDLRKREGEIFGGTGKEEGRSPFSLRILSGPIRSEVKALLPHHDAPSYQGNRSPRLYAIVDHSFQVVFSYRSLPSGFSPDQLQALFELCSLLGSLGKRSRRGFGSFQIQACNGHASELSGWKDQNSLQMAILIRLNLLSGDKYEIGDQVIRLRKTCSGNYPYIEKIGIGQSAKNLDALLKTIGHSSHRCNGNEMGMGGKGGRLASPEYVSVVQGGDLIWPVITSLHLVFNPKNGPGQSGDQRVNFRAAILRGASET